MRFIRKDSSKRYDAKINLSSISTSNTKKINTNNEDKTSKKQFQNERKLKNKILLKLKRIRNTFFFYT